MFYRQHICVLNSAVTWKMMHTPHKPTTKVTSENISDIYISSLTEKPIHVYGSADHTCNALASLIICSYENMFLNSSEMAQSHLKDLFVPHQRTREPHSESTALLLEPRVQKGGICLCYCLFCVFSTMIQDKHVHTWHHGQNWL